MSNQITKIALGLVALCAVSTPLHSVAAPTKTVHKAAPHAAQPGRADTNGSAVFNQAYKAYTDRICRKVDGHWYLADGKNHVVLAVDLATDGTVTNLQMSSSPSNTAAEQAANDAFNQSQPLEPLPSSSPPVRLTITFESNADPHGDNNHSLSARIDALSSSSANKSETSQSAPEGTPDTTQSAPDTNQTGN